MGLVILLFTILHMKNIVKGGLAGVVALHAGIASAAITLGESKVDAGLRGDDAAADTAIQTLITNAISFLYLVAVVFALWWGFNILTAGGDEEKVKKGKTILIQAGIGLVVIFLASSIVKWVVGSLLGTS
jgi:hypothetical protein